MKPKIKQKLTEISSSNALVYIESKSDLQSLQKYISLEPKIIKKIEGILREKKDDFLQFFLGNKRFENIFVYIAVKKNRKERQLYIGKHTSKLPQNVTLFCINSSYGNDLIDTCVLARYKFHEYKSSKENVKETHTYAFVTKETKSDITKRIGTISHILLARDLWETPPNILTPESFAKKVKKTKFKNTKVSIITPKQIEKKKLWLIHAVGKGSENKPHMVILERIVDKKLPTIGIIGKGITFDTGGIQVKPENFMYEMKGDMWGAAVTYALMKELDEKELSCNIVACLCLAENAISSASYKPSDVITGYTGKTVEVIHTDAEGRLVLGDGIAYVSKNYKTTKIISIATLTGACMVALGYRYAGVMGTDAKLIQKIVSYGKKNPEQYSELPFDDHFIEKTKSEIADLKNLDRGVYAGSSMWGAFLSNFLENEELYTHIDIAGTYLNGGDPYGKVNKGATGFWVESLSEILTSL